MFRFTRRIAVFIDGGFYLKRLPKMGLPASFHNTPKAVAKTAYELCKRHVQRLVESHFREDGRWLQFAYRFFYYDAWPYDGTAHNPLTNQQIKYSETPEAKFRRKLFEELRKTRKFAVRLGHVQKVGGWRMSDHKKLKRLLNLTQFSQLLRDIADGRKICTESWSEEKRRCLINLSDEWNSLGEADVTLELRQKGVDMRLGMDIASIVLKKQANTLVLVTGDSDFVPVAKLARREGAEVILDPMRQNIQPALQEHVDDLYSVLGREQVA